MNASGKFSAMDADKVKKILVITLSNIGDVVLTTAVFNALRKNFPASTVDVIVGARAAPIFTKDPRIHKVMSYDKSLSLSEKAKFILSLRSERYDLVVDLRNTLMPFLLRPRYKTSILSNAKNASAYKKEIHLSRLTRLGIDVRGADFDIWIDKADEDYAGELLRAKADGFIVLAPGARSDTKRWGEECFSELARMLLGGGARVVLVGDLSDKKIADGIAARTSADILNLCAKTTLTQLAAVLKRATLVISNDSAVMHVAAAVGTPTIAIFGPTAPLKYGPRGRRDVILRKDLACSPCEKAQCPQARECLKLITADEVYGAALRILTNR